jgi:hypothetical protein
MRPVALMASACAASTLPPTPVPTASAAPTPSPTPAPTPSPTPAPTLPAGQVPPGTYRAGFVTYTLPAGWTAFGSVTILKPNANPPKGFVVDQWRAIATVYGDPCHWQTTGGSVGPTVDALVAALVAQKRGSTVTPVAVTIDGFSGKQIDLMVPLDVALGSCDRPIQVVDRCVGE